MSVEGLAHSRTVGPTAAVKTAITYHQQPLQPSSRVIRPPTLVYAAGPVFALIRPAGTEVYIAKPDPGFHQLSDQHELLSASPDIILVGVFLMVVMIGFGRSIVAVVRRQL